MKQYGIISKLTNPSNRLSETLSVFATSKQRQLMSTDRLFCKMTKRTETAGHFTQANVMNSHTD